MICTEFALVYFFSFLSHYARKSQHLTLFFNRCASFCWPISFKYRHDIDNNGVNQIEFAVNNEINVSKLAVVADKPPLFHKINDA